MPELFCYCCCFHFPLAGESKGCNPFRDTAEKKADKLNVNNALVCEFHLNPSYVNMLIGKGK